MRLQVRVLGPVEALVNGRALTLGGHKQRSVLAMLALRVNTVLSAEELIDGVWGDDPPASAAKNVQLYVSQLRKLLADAGAGGEIVTHGRSYELRLPEDAVDAVRFERLLENAARDRADQAGNGAATKALELWRGAPLADVASAPFAGSEIRRLEELRMRVAELKIDAELAAGRHAEVISELETLIAADPLHERFHAQRMIALYRSDRQSEALGAYRDAHRTLAREIGVDPGPELQALQEAILAQDPSLDAPPVEELPAQLRGGSPLLAGRAHELRWLRERWKQAIEGGPVVALVCGPAGIGKTRLIAELAAEVRESGAAVHCCGGGEVVDAALAVIGRAQRSTRPVLLVLDYADDAPPTVLEAAARLARESRSSPLLICVLGHDERAPPAFAGLLEAGLAHPLVLGALGAEPAAEIAMLYASAEGAAMPVETLIAASEGVPLRVHRAASEWARSEAAERLVTSLDRVAGERTGLREAELDVTGDISDLQAASERTRLYLVGDSFEPADPATCPFRGLAPFDAAHAEYFFGRERLVAELVARLVGSTLLAIVGPSGSGKSSAMRAGLLPALATGIVPGSERWRQAVLRPGQHPHDELSRTLARILPGAGVDESGPTFADALERLAEGERLVLAVDQLEEAFSLCDDETERNEFFDALVAGANDPDERLIVVLAIRADFYGRCAEHGALSAMLGANQLLVGPMRREELRRAIELPARKAGLGVEPRLVSVLVADAADEPGGLPLLSTALLELWQRRDGRTLRYGAYERSGGVRGAVARLAEGAYQRLSESERRRARPMLLRLAGAEEEAEAFVRRRVPLDELEIDRDPDAARALAVLTEARLLTVDEGSVEVAHEALLSEWPRLHRWLAEDAEGRRLHQHLIAATREWRDSERDPAELYRGARLAAALDWASEHNPELNELEREFLDESRAGSEREAERQRRANRRLRTLLAGVGVLLAAAVVAGVIAISERQGALDAARAEAAQRLGGEALTEDRLDRALLLANAGAALDDSVTTRSNLLSTLLRSPAAIGILTGDGDPFGSVALSPDGHTLAVGGVGGGTVTLFDTETREPIGRPYETPGTIVEQMAFAPGGDTLLVASLIEDPARAYLDFIDPRTAEGRRSISLGGYPGDPDRIWWPSFAYSPDGETLVVAHVADEFDEPQPTILQRLDAETGERRGEAVTVPAKPGEDGLIATPDGRRLFLFRPGATFAVDPSTLRLGRRYSGAVSATASTDGGTLALGARDGTVRVLDLGSGRVRKLAGRHDGGLLSVGFSPNGALLATGGEDGRVLIWDLAKGNASEVLEGHGGRVLGLAFSPSGDTLYSAGREGTAIAWDVAGDRRLGRQFRAGLANTGVEPFPPSFAVSPDGRTLAVARLDGDVELIDTETLERVERFTAFPRRSAYAIEYAPDGRTLAVAGAQGAAGIWDAESATRIGPLLPPPGGPAGHLQGGAQRGGHGKNIQGISFTPNGELLATASIDGTVRVWDVERRVSALPPIHVPPFALGVDFSPDGTTLAIAGGVGGEFGAPQDGVEIRDVETGERITRLPTDDEVREATFSPDGRLLVSGQFDGKAVIWSTDDWEPVGRPLAAHGGFVLAAAFSPDGRTLATSGTDGTAVLWDVASQTRIGSPLTREEETWVTAAFAPDGERLFALDDAGGGIRWDVDTSTWRRHACEVAGRDLTGAEWDDILPEQDYVAGCASD